MVLCRNGDYPTLPLYRAVIVRPATVGFGVGEVLAMVDQRFWEVDPDA